MSKLLWDKIGNRFYETGIDKVVLYLLEHGKYSDGVAWDGVTSISESPSGAESTALYANNKKYLSLVSAEEFGATIEAYAYPDEFKRCCGEVELRTGVTIGQQRRLHFGLVYRTIYGNDELGDDYGYKIHLVFDSTTSSTEKSYETINDSPDAVTFSWEISSNPVNVDEDNYKPTATLILDSTKFKMAGLANVLAAIEDTLYGTTKTAPQLPTINEIEEIILIQMYVRDNDNESLLDSNGNRIQSRVFE